MASTANITGALYAVGDSWSVKSVRDLNGDGNADVLWYNAETGGVNGWLMNGTTKTVGGVIHAGIDPIWQIDGVRDINGDGKFDVLWRHQQSGNMNGWIMNGLTKQSGGFIRTACIEWNAVNP
ncbi:MAG: VCBS repeat-containing protein [Phycisphaerales bacterium]|nr:VCBS repeat-containing protein [Phycisphaerales bacterium]